MRRGDALQALLDGTVIPIGHSCLGSVRSAFAKYDIGRDV